MIVHSPGDSGNEGRTFVSIDREGWIERHWGGALPASMGRAHFLSWISSLLGSPSKGAAHVRLFGTPRFEPSLPEDLRSRVHLDVFAPPGELALDRIELQAFAVEVGNPMDLELTRFASGGSGWTVRAPGMRMGYLPCVASQAQEVRAAYRETIELGFGRLQAMGFLPTDLARTWFHFRDVLGEYAAFNELRASAFARCGIEVLPASTGIQGLASTGEHVVMGLLAYAGTRVQRTRVSNPVQAEADAYGSLFSRAIRVEGAGPCQYLVSGTAAIDELGRTMNPHDPCRQLSDALDRTTRLLGACGLDWKDVAGGAVFLAPAHHAALAAGLATTPLAGLPLAWVMADICRPDLACEIELMAFGQPAAN